MTAAFLLSPTLATPAALRAAGPPRVAVDGNAVTIATERYEVVWPDGSTVGLTTLLPGRVDLTAKAAPTDVAQLPNGLGSFHGQPAQAVYAQHARGPSRGVGRRSGPRRDTGGFRPRGRRDHPDELVSGAAAGYERFIDPGPSGERQTAYDVTGGTLSER